MHYFKWTIGWILAINALAVVGYVPYGVMLKYLYAIAILITI